MTKFNTKIIANNICNGAENKDRQQREAHNYTNNRNSSVYTIYNGCVWVHVYTFKPRTKKQKGQYIMSSVAITMGNNRSSVAITIEENNMRSTFAGVYMGVFVNLFVSKTVKIVISGFRRIGMWVGNVTGTNR